MKIGDVQIVNKLGLHARAASRLINTTKSFACQIELQRADDTGADAVDAKSIMAVMMLEAVCGATLTLTCAGDDEDEAFAAIRALFADRFGEDE